MLKDWCSGSNEPTIYLCLIKSALFVKSILRQSDPSFSGGRGISYFKTIELIKDFRHPHPPSRGRQYTRRISTRSRRLKSIVFRSRKPFLKQIMLWFSCAALSVIWIQIEQCFLKVALSYPWSNRSKIFLSLSQDPRAYSKKHANPMLTLKSIPSGGACATSRNAFLFVPTDYNLIVFYCSTFEFKAELGHLRSRRRACAGNKLRRTFEISPLHNK